MARLGLELTPAAAAAAAPSQNKMRKTLVAYPWNPLVALGMGEANWWQPSVPNSHFWTVRKSKHRVWLVYS